MRPFLRIVLNFIATLQRILVGFLKSFLVCEIRPYKESAGARSRRRYFCRCPICRNSKGRPCLFQLSWQKHPSGLHEFLPKTWNLWRTKTSLEDATVSGSELPYELHRTVDNIHCSCPLCQHHSKLEQCLAALNEGFPAIFRTKIGSIVN